MRENGTFGVTRGPRGINQARPIIRPDVSPTVLIFGIVEEEGFPERHEFLEGHHVIGRLSRAIHCNNEMVTLVSVRQKEPLASVTRSFGPRKR